MKICLDAGHYGKYNQSPSVKAYYESDMAWKLHLILKKRLEQYGITVILTRENQAIDKGIIDRGKASAGCDLFISVHSNAVGSGVNESIDYPVVYVPLNGSANIIGERLAKCIEQTMKTKQPGRATTRKGSQGDYYGVIRGAVSVGTPGIILEHSFHTNSASAMWLLKDSNLEKLAEAEAKVIADYYKLKGDDPMKFTPRLTAPSTNSKYWYSANPFYKEGNGLPNCTCYAWGRFYEITGKEPTFLGNAEDFYGRAAKDYKRGQTPKLGSIICWRKGVAEDNSDGAGHVAVVEKINSDGSIVISQSAWNGARFWTQTLTKPYAYGPEYTLQGFIYPPMEFENEGDEKAMSSLKVGDLVKVKKGAIWSTGKSVPDWVLKDTWKVADVSKSPLVKIDKNKAETNSIKSWLDVKYLETVSEPETIANITLNALREGSKGGEVRTLQRLLICLGYDLGTYGADGDFGAKTSAAVKAFQKKNGLTVDGIVGTNTWNKLLKG